MKHLPTIAIAASLTLAACAEPIPEDDPVTPQDAPTATAAADPADSSDGSGQPSDAAWFVKDGGMSAVYGPPESEGVIVFACRKNDMGNPELAFTWNIAATEGGSETVTMGWGDETRATESFDAEATPTELGPSGYFWSATLDPAGEEANFLLAATAPVTFTMGTKAEKRITVPAGDELKGVIQACKPEG